MNLLFDTNIVIGLEDAGEVQRAFADLARKCGEHRIGLHVHEASKADVARDRNAVRRKATLSKLRKFAELSDVAVPPDEELSALYGSLGRHNDRVDATLLHAVARDVVDFLVTEDDGLHRRARKVGLADRVFTVADALAWIGSTFEPREVSLPSVESQKAYALDPGDPIFHELRADYAGFDGWLRKCVAAHRDCWVVRDGGAIAALLIRKDERHADAGTLHGGPRIMKICTFKVAASHRGRKLGEQLLKQALWHAQRNAYDLVYLTTFGKQETLIRLLEDFGFGHARTAANGELFYEKGIGSGPLSADGVDDVLAADRSHYPRFVDGDAIRKFLVPIRPAYHAKLFPELSPATEAPPGSPGNTIRKVYLCWAATRQMRPGDVVLFYRTKSSGGTSQAITSIGVVETVRMTEDLAELRRWTGKRSVFSDEELREMVARKVPIKVVDFLLVGHVEPPVALRVLERDGVLKGPPQSITRLGDAAWRTLKPRLATGFDF